MLLFVLFVGLLKTAITYEDNSCECNVGRSRSDIININFLDILGVNSEKQCPIRADNEWEEGSVDKAIASNMILVPAGDYQLGTDDIVIEADREGPKRIVALKSFYLDKYEVSNRDYSNFVISTKYKTEAEKFGDSFVFAIFLNNTLKEKFKDYRVAQATWWYKLFGADWKHPYGPGSNITDIMHHPVIHVSWRDAKAYCEWRDSRLPTEAEWEAACRGGHKGTKYPWGNKLFPGRKHMANIWQGTFPHYNSAKDGFIGTNPVEYFPQNNFGFHNIAGNVWEWTENSWSDDNPNEKVKKGGSYLCHHSYCYRYRCSARSHNTQDSSAGNLGFRCAKSLPVVN